MFGRNATRRRSWRGPTYGAASTGVRVGLLAICLLFAQAASAQVHVGNSRVRVPSRGMESLKLELHAVNDDVLMYAGGPNDILLLEVRPRGVTPRVDISGGPHPTLRVRDLSLYDGPVSEQVYVDGEAYEEEGSSHRVPDSQEWEAILTAMVPTDFFLDLEKGSGNFDLTDMHVRNLHVRSHLTHITLEFSRQNVGVLERLQLSAEGGDIELREFLNARPRSVTVQANESGCDVQLTGKPFEGEAEIYFTGVPERMRFEISRDIGVRIEGPAATVARFDAKHMERRGQALYSRGYDERPCKVLLHFAEIIDNLGVDWD